MGTTSLRLHMRIIVFAALFIALLTPLAGCSGEEDFRSGHETWLDSRVQSLRTNWVSLAGLYWIEGNEITLGSAEEASVSFPDDAPAIIGTLFIDRGGEHRFVAHDDVETTVEGQVFAEGAIRSDSDGSPTTVETGPYRFSLIERYGRNAIRLHDTRRQDLVSAEDLPYYPLDEAWRISGRFEAHPVPAIVMVPTYTGDIQELVSPGTIHFQVDGWDHSLDVMTGGEATYFVMFGDQTNRDETYGAGRYLYIDHEDEQGNVVIDFNRAYNPPCAFTPYATCPYPPPQNNLAVRIEAGEQRVAENW
jgi:uncharacterized protein